MLHQALNGMITVMLTKFLLNDVPHAAGLLGNPSSSSNPGVLSAETATIMARARLEEYKPPPSGVFTKRDESLTRRKRKPPTHVRTKNVWIYRIVMKKEATVAE